MTRIAAILTSVLAILVAPALLAHEPTLQEPRTPRATVKRLKGDAQLLRAGAHTWQNLTVGMTIAAGDTFATGLRSEMELVFTDDDRVAASYTVPPLTLSTLEDYIRNGEQPKAPLSQGFILQMGDTGLIDITDIVTSVPCPFSPKEFIGNPPPMDLDPPNRPRRRSRIDLIPGERSTRRELSSSEYAHPTPELPPLDLIPPLRLDPCVIDDLFRMGHSPANSPPRRRVAHTS